MISPQSTTVPHRAANTAVDSLVLLEDPNNFLHSHMGLFSSSSKTVIGLHSVVLNMFSGPCFLERQPKHHSYPET